LVAHNSNLYQLLAKAITPQTVSNRVLAQDIPPDSDGISTNAERIVGGQDANPGEWPWQAIVINGSGLCGGSLIHPPTLGADGRALCWEQCLDL
jgi:hypothetical protein